MIDLAFLRHLDKFSLIINKRVTSSYAGERQSLDPGAGLVFRDYASYSYGDDFKAIDWRVFARTDRLFVKRYEAERNLTVHIILDHSASMNFGSKDVTKSEYASMLGIGYAYMALKNNERFVLSTFAEGLQLFKPRKGRKQLASVVALLNKRKPQGLTDIQTSLANYKKLIGSKSMIVIISDFLYPPGHIANALARLLSRYRHDVQLIQVLDKVELDLQGIEGDYKLRDSESAATMRTFINPLMKRNYARKLSDHNAAVQKTAQDYGCKYHLFTSDTPVFDAFYDIMTRCKQCK